MNKNSHGADQDLLPYQTARLQDLLTEIQQCCQSRTVYQSRRFHLPQAQINCLLILARQPYLTVTHLAQRLEAAKSRASKLVDELAEAGLVRRSEDPNDGRVKLVGLTPAGKDKTGEIEQFLAEIHQEILKRLPPDQRRDLLSHMEVLRQSMEAVKEMLSRQASEET